jgi:hypothetical protein
MHSGVSGGGHGAGAGAGAGAHGFGRGSQGGGGWNGGGRYHPSGAGGGGWNGGSVLHPSGAGGGGWNGGGRYHPSGAGGGGWNGGGERWAFPARFWPAQFPWWYGVPSYPAPLPLQTCSPGMCLSRVRGSQGTCCSGNECAVHGIDPSTGLYVGLCTHTV